VSANDTEVERGARRARRSIGFSASSASSAFLVYLLFTLALTWPLARGLTRDVASDFGDPLFAMWVLSWDATHLGAGLWNANIFHPHPLALAYSEHFLPQAIQVLPIYALTKNPILSYNLLVLSTFVLSGLGMFLFVRDLTGSAEAAWVGGFAYAFAPYRMASLPHPQVLSSAWLPFALFAFRRFLAGGKWPALAAGVGFWVVQNLSCGYYLFFFSPVIALYLAWELTVRNLWRDGKTVGAIAAACAAAAVLTLPFLLPYLQLRQMGFTARSAAEVDRFSADVYAYLTAAPNLRLWGSIARAWPKAEGSLFPGLTIVALAGAGVWRAWRAARFDRWGSIASAAAGVLIVALLAGWTVRLGVVRITSLARALVVVVVLKAALLAFSRETREATRRWTAQPASIFAGIVLLGVVMSFGTAITAKGRTIFSPAPFVLLYRVVPGADALRVPARFAMVVTFGLAVLAGLGVAAIRAERLRRRVGVAAAVLIAAEFLAIPIPINGNSTTYERPGLAPLPDRVYVGEAAPPVYRAIANLPPASAIVELPLGEPAFDIRYMFYSTQHWRPLVNGYSGGEPADYEVLDRLLQDAGTEVEARDGGRSEGRRWEALARTGATHAVVHERYYRDDIGPRVSAWLRSRGAHEISAFGGDRLFQLPFPTH
jgi:hypothetical protein